MKHIAIFLILFTTILLHGNQPEVLIETDKLKAYSCDTLVFFGLDFSSLYLLNELKLDQGSKMKEVYAPVWLERFYDNYDERRLGKLFGAETFILDVESFQNRQLSLAIADSMVRAEQRLITPNLLQYTVNNYQISKNNGVGVSLVVEEFNKSREEVSILFTFFDLDTKKILYAVRDFGEAGTYGMEWHWRIGLTSAMYEFMVNEYYFDKKKTLKQHKKNNR